MSLYGESSLCLCYWKPHVCNSVYKTRYSTCNGSRKPIYKQPKKTTLGSSQVDSQVLER